MYHRLSSRKTSPIVALFFSLALVLTAAFPSAAQTPISMWIYHAPGTEAWAEAFEADFNEANPDIELDVVLSSFSELREKLLVASATGVGPDLAYMPSNLMVEWITQGISRPIDEYVDKMADRDDFLPDVLDALRDEKGRLHALPYGMWPIFDLYNADVFEQNGVAFPQDWEELIAAARANTRLGSDGVVERFGYTSSANNLILIYDMHMYMEQLGQGLLYIGDSNVTLNNERGHQALDFIQELWATGMPNFATGGHSYDGVVNGSTAIMSAATYPAMTLDVGSTNLSLRSVVGPEPGQDVVRHNAGNIYMLATTEHPDEAWRAMEAFLQADVLRGFYEIQGQWLPVRRSMFNEIQELYPYALAPEMVALFNKPLYTYGARHGYWGKVHSLGGDILLKAVKGETGNSAALEEAERVMNSVLREEIAAGRN